jgi:glycerol-3-phosphate dehydrogenase (NAD(P)+)
LRDNKEKIAIIGGGSSGTSLAILLGSSGYDVSLWCRREEQADKINRERENKQYLEGYKLPECVIATHCVSRCVNGTDLAIFAVPSDYVRTTAKLFADHIDRSAILHTVKGIESGSGKLMSEVLKEELGADAKIAAISGPNHAEEVAGGLPTATVVASEHKALSVSICNLLNTPNFKSYPLWDIKGVELCGAIKNIVAIAIGISDGLGLGDNAKASLLTLGLSEMSRIAESLGAKKETCFSIAGVGDLIATCSSKHSRNRFVGEKLAKGQTIDQINIEMHGMVAEGVKNTRSIYNLCQSNNLDTILIEHMYRVLYERLDIPSAIEQTMDRL